VRFKNWTRIMGLCFLALSHSCCTFGVLVSRVALDSSPPRATTGRVEDWRGTP